MFDQNINPKLYKDAMQEAMDDMIPEREWKGQGKKS